MLKWLIRVGALLIAVIALNGCAVMAARTGVRAVKNLREEEREREAAAAGTSAPAERSGLVHRPGLLIKTPPTNSAHRASASQPDSTPEQR